MSTKCEEYIEIADGMDTGPETEASSAETANEHWEREDTFRLIELFKEHQNQYREYDNKSKFWKFMQQELLKYDVNRTTKSIRTKWSNLLRTYKMIVKNHPNHREPKKFAFFWALDEILKHEPFGSAAENSTAAENIDSDTILIDGDDDASEIDCQNDLLDETDSNESSTNRPKRLCKNDYYSSRISELEDRRRIRHKKLKLAVAREERKIRQLALKEKKFQLAKLRYELDKRRLILDENKLSMNLKKD